LAPVLERYPDFAALIAQGEDAAASDRLRRAETIGRPVGGEDFLLRLEKLTRCRLIARKPGPKPRPGRDTRQMELSGLSP
jgi:putative transposase